MSGSGSSSGSGKSSGSGSWLRLGLELRLGLRVGLDDGRRSLWPLRSSSSATAPSGLGGASRNGQSPVSSNGSTSAHVAAGRHQLELQILVMQHVP